jgi:hypothetical protein
LQFVGAPFLDKQQPKGLAPLPTRPSAAAGDAGSGPGEKLYFGSTANTWKKIIPLGLMFFCILFNYTILRDTKVRNRYVDQDARKDPAHRVVSASGFVFYTSAHVMRFAYFFVFELLTCSDKARANMGCGILASTLAH